MPNCCGAQTRELIEIDAVDWVVIERTRAEFFSKALKNTQSNTHSQEAMQRYINGCILGKLQSPYLYVRSPLLPSPDDDGRSDDATDTPALAWGSKEM